MGIFRIEVAPKLSDDAVRVRTLKRFKDLCPAVVDVLPVRILTVEKDLSVEQLERVGDSARNPVLESFVVGPTKIAGFDFALEVGFLPGVTDNVAHTSKELIEDLLKVNFGDGEAVASSMMYLIKGTLSKADLDFIALNISNSLIEHYRVLDARIYGDTGFEPLMPKVKILAMKEFFVEVDLEVSDEELIKIGQAGVVGPDGVRRGPLALSLEELRVIREYFRGLGRNPRDIELESIAQTWSEHCKHKIFASPLDELQDGLYKHYIKGATKEIRARKGEKDFCVSVFKDNSGVIKFNERYYLTDKAETHNSPSALDPFGGAVTGVVGVNRDTLGTGMGAKPIANRYGFCFADPRDIAPLYRDAGKTNQMLPPKRIVDGVIKGIEAGANQSGIPGPQGFLYFDERFKGKPLVFAGTVGLMPTKVNGKDSTEKSALAGDLVVVIGGRVGADGIHGATFSSESLSEGSPSTAVQIGDAITQKRFLDAILMEARDAGLYSSITDNGAGGISCSVAEMAKESGGFVVDLEKVPLKYANLEPWQIWISESQERMTLAVPPANWAAFKKIMDKHGVEATVIGEFNDSGMCLVRHNGVEILHMAMEFLHEGVPLVPLYGSYERPVLSEPRLEVADFGAEVVKLLGQLNIASHEKVSTVYDHEVQGMSVVKPLQGKGRVNGRATVLRPDYNDWRGAVMSQGINPRYSDLDTYDMAACAIDTAVRNAVSVGANVDYMALMDNFCWCSSYEPLRLGQLKEAVRACYDYAVAYGAPYISGKDSMFNDFKGFNASGEAVNISVPPTLMASALGVVEDVRKSLTLDPKCVGDLVYVLGVTKNELGGSEFYAMYGELGANVPKVDSDYALALYRQFHAAKEEELFASAISVELGGLAAAFGKMVIAGELGLNLNLASVGDLPLMVKLFSESQSRFVVTVNPALRERFEAVMSGKFALIGEVVAEQSLKIDQEVNVSLSALRSSYFASNDLYL